MTWVTGGVPASKRCGGALKVVFSKETRWIMLPPAW